MDNTGAFQKDILILIPAAGYGSRVGSPPAKELLLHPKTQKPFIVEALAKIPHPKSQVLVISRREKLGFNQFLQKYEIPTLILDQPTKEWPDTLLKSEPHWREWNFILLPDTDYEPADSLLKLVEKSKQTSAKALFAVFDVSDLSTWGAVSQSARQICEKPQNKLPVDQWKAWGLFAFHKSVGRELLEKMLESTLGHQIFDLSFAFDLISLNSFDDLTRGTPK
ncbi:MAG: hypothetical protein AB7O96_13935 [Pseudobdellovibrionaceae bacterium]